MTTQEQDVHRTDDLSQTVISDKKRKIRSQNKSTKDQSHKTITIKSPPFAYIHLQLKIVSVPNSKSNPGLDELTTRRYLTSALSQFLGLTGSAISIDILKVEDREVWIRVAREDLRAVVAAVGGWVDRKEELGWRVMGSSTWLAGLNGTGEEKVWGDFKTGSVA